MPAVFGNGKDERMARVVISIARRAKLNSEANAEWLKAVLADAKFPEIVSVRNLIDLQHARHLLTSRWSELSVDDRPSAGADVLKANLRDALPTIL